jgi:hypothetical protein
MVEGIKLWSRRAAKVVSQAWWRRQHEKNVAKTDEV